jgi:hypothetical protein
MKQFENIFEKGTKDHLYHLRPRVIYRADTPKARLSRGKVTHSPVKFAWWFYEYIFTDPAYFTGE